MSTKRRTRLNVSLGAVLMGAWLMTASAVHAQQITGVLGEPSATTTINGNRIPAPEPQFGGVIKETLEGSKTCGRLALCRLRALPTCCSS
jgi:hypothetical protein